MIREEVKKKIRPLVQLLPAVVVAGLVIGSLPGSGPVLADIPEFGKICAAYGIDR